ncbi:hypothetical protein DL764_003254 [Monosporascus ibericus]|uniref:SAM-dependent MTase RsmB/NOP-type domain-containing protein n=1 Tax=Monosporascus ibericus TaxID=155417 RepID=A0A4Q4TL44_9PEZI|nr:hypothetical protein DL764_003254 [Monosporascus ibericus]
MVLPKLSLYWFLALCAVVPGWEHTGGDDLQSSIEENAVSVVAFVPPAKILAWINRVQRPVISDVVAESLGDFKKADETVIIAYLDEGDETLRAAFFEVAGKYREEFTFGLVTDAGAIEAEKITGPTVRCVKPLDEDSRDLHGFTDVESLEKFVKENSRPLIGELLPHNHRRFLERGWPMVYVFAATESERSEIRTTLKETARSYYESLTMVTVDPLEFPDLPGKLGLESSAFPSGAVHQLSADKIYPYPKGRGLTPNELLSWGLDVWQERVKPWTPPGVTTSYDNLGGRLKATRSVSIKKIPGYEPPIDHALATGQRTMSLYHEAADILSASGGNLKTRIFGRKDLKAPPQQIYALALETCKWSSVLKEVIEASELMRHERKLSPLLALLLVHDFLLSKRGVALPATHGLRTSIERHKARLNAEFTRARIRRKAGSMEALRQQVTTEHQGEAARYPRWVRVNTLKTTLEDQLASTFKDFTRVYSIGEVTDASSGKLLHVDEHIPNLLAVSPSFEFAKTEAYSSGAVILQDKASCFPAYLLDPLPEDGDVIDSCAAPGNKTTHLAALVHSRTAESEQCAQRIYAFEKDKHRALTLEKMVKLAGAKDIIRISFAQDFLKVDPNAQFFKDVGALLLDPSCSGSGIVGRDAMPTIHLPELPSSNSNKSQYQKSRKRKRGDDARAESTQEVFVDDDGTETVVATEKELKVRLEALSSFQLKLLLHALEFPAATKVTYSTCSVHAEENEQVVLRALQSEVGRRRGWRILKRDEQVRGLREWPVRGTVDASNGDTEVADACIRSYKDDGRGVMGFFVAGFVRDAPEAIDDDGPFLRDENGRIIRDASGMPTLKAARVSDPSRASATSSFPVEGPDGDEEMTENLESEDLTTSGDESSPDEKDEDEWNGFD